MLRLAVKISKHSANACQSRGFATYKTSTGLTGLRVDPNGRETLLKLSEEVLHDVKVINLPIG